MVQVASNVFENHQRLISDGASMLFNDICGTGPDSGMWWHDDLDHVNEILEHHAKHLDKREDMFRSEMHPCTHSGIGIRI